MKLALLLFGILLLASCTQTTQNTADPATRVNQAYATDTPTTNTVTIQGYAFQPETITVKAGTTVTWTNKDSVSHLLKSTLFTSNALTLGDTFTYTFTTAGTYDYSCQIHPSMKGKVIVE